MSIEHDMISIYFMNMKGILLPISAKTPGYIPRNFTIPGVRRFYAVDMKTFKA